MNEASRFTYLGLLFAIVVIGISLAVTGQVWSTASQREREVELIFRGNEIQGHRQVYDASPGPRSTLEHRRPYQDSRFPVTKRHLRRFYEDPFTGKPDWDL